VNRPLYGGCPLFGGSVIRGFTVYLHCRIKSLGIVLIFIYSPLLLQRPCGSLQGSRHLANRSSPCMSSPPTWPTRPQRLSYEGNTTLSSSFIRRNQRAQASYVFQSHKVRVVQLKTAKLLTRGKSLDQDHQSVGPRDQVQMKARW